jgi:hypothetical protein
MTDVHPSQPTFANPINEPDTPSSALQSPLSKTLEDRKNEIYSSVDSDRNHIHDELDQVITEKQNNGTADELLDLVIAVEPDSLDAALDYFETLGGIIGRRLNGPAFYGFSGSIASSRISEVSRLGTVEMMELVHEMKRNSDVALDLTNVRSYLWDTLNYTGDWNSSIAVLDTGIDDTHPMLSPWNNLSFTDGKVVGWYDATDDRSALPEDINSHGSHCAGIAAGYEYNLTDNDNRTKSTWGIKYPYSTSGAGYFSYYIEVKSTGWINIATWWNGTPGETSNYVELWFPNATKADEVTTSNQNRNLSLYVSEGDTGIYQVRVHVSYNFGGGTFWATGLNTYPYTPPPANHGMYGGVAPDAKLISVKIFDNTGYGTNIEMVDGLNWLLKHVDDYHIVAASMSVSFSVTVPSVDSAVASLAYHGVIPVISAGNDGQGSNSIHSPSHVDECICVGATGDYNQITSYSSEGPGFGNLTKPDLVAPGGVSTQGAILSVDSNDQEADNGFWEQQPDDMAIMQGTSMSTPHVAGLVALLAQAMGGAANWDWNSATKPFKMKQLLMMTSYEVYSLGRGTKDDVEGYGRVNPDAALDAYLYSLPIGTTYIETLNNGTYGRKAGARHLTLLSGTQYNFTLEIPDNADFDLYLYDGNPTTKGEPILLDKSVNTTLGGLEQIMFTPSSTKSYYIVVKYMTGYGGQFKITALSRVEDAPSVELVSPTNNTIQQSGTLVDLVITDVNGDLDTVEYHWDTDFWVTLSSPHDTSIPNGDDGHYLYVNATDNKDNYNYSIFYFTADSTVPSVVLNSPSNNTVHKSSTLVDTSISDTHLANVYVKWNAGSWGLWSSPYDTNLPSGDGLQTLYINASDSAGNYNYTILVFYTDDTNPTVILSSPLNNTIQQSGTLIDVSISDTNLDSVQSKWDSGSWSPWSSPYDTNIPAGNGDHLLYVNASDEAGNFNYTIYVFIADNTNPDVTLDSPLNNTVQNSGISVDITVSDSNLNTVYMKWDFGLWTEFDSPYDTTIPFGNGFHTLHVNATDDAGNYNYSIYVFTVDDDNPSVILVSPSNNTVQKGNTLINVSISDTNLASVQHKWDMGDWIPWSSTYDTNLPSGDGEHILYINATDTAGNFNYTWMIFETDDTIPVVILNSPGNNTVHNSGISIDVSVTDTNLDFVYYNWDTTSWTPWAFPYDTTLPSGDSDHVLYVNATDDAGNSNHSIYVFTTDDTNPNVELSSPANETIHNSGKLINISVSDINLVSVEYKWDTDIWAPWSSHYDTTLPVGDGLHTLYVIAMDDADNFNYTIFTFTADNTYPSVILNSPINNTLQKSGITIDVGISDTNLATVYHKWDTSSPTEWNTPYDTSLPSGDGQHILYVNATDAAGNSNYTLFIFYTDDTKPTVILNSPSNETVHNGNTLIDLSVSDTNLASVQYRWDSGTSGPLSSPYDTNLPFGDGLHTLYVNASDDAGNFNYSIFVFTTDDTNPEVSLNSPANNTIHNSGVTIDTSVSDTNLVVVQYKWDTDDWSTLNSPYDTYLPSGDGAHTLLVNASDSAGNINYNVFVFTTDDTNPSVVLISPTNNTVHNSLSLIDVLISDTNLDFVYRKWDTSSWIEWNSPYDTNLPSGEGSHTLHVNATDEAGNTNYTLYVFFTDDLNPTVLLSTLENNTVHNSGITIDLAISDTNLGIVYYKWDTLSWAELSSPYDTSLPSGEIEHALYINATDLADNYNYTYFVFTTDNTNPSVVLNTPLNQSMHNNGELIDVVIFDVNLASTQYKWDSDSWGTWNSPYDTTLSSGDGLHTLYVNATDNAGNYNYSVFVFTTDDTNPVVVLISPLKESILVSGTLINCSISDINLDSVDYKWDSGSWSPWPASYDTDLPEADGAHILYVNASDLAGNFNYSIFVFTADNTNPSVVLISPVNNTIHNSGNSIDVSISDSHLFDAQYKWDSGGWGLWSSPYDTSLPSIDGPHTLYVNATDDVGNINYTIFTFTTDDTNPSVVLVTPANNTVHNSGSSIDLAISDINLVLAQYKWDTDSWATLPAPYDTSLPMGAGFHTLHINATDSASNENYTLYIFTTDDDAPSIILNSPSNETVHNSGTLIDLKVSDTNIALVQYKWDTYGWSTLNSPYDTNLPPSDSIHTLYMNATDAAGNINLTTFVFYTDDTNPSVILNSPSNNTVHKSGETIDIAVSDTNLNLVYYKWDALSWTELMSPYDTTLPAGEGSHVLHVNATDAAGNQNYTVYIFETDTLNPTVLLITPENDTNHNSGITIDVSVSDINLEIVYYKWDAASWTEWNSPYDTNLPTGEILHSLYVNATDLAGNFNYTYYSFTTDDTTPSVVLNSPLNENVNTGGVQVDVGISDLHLETVQSKWDTDAWGIWNSPYDTSLPFGDGLHTLYVNATDDAGNFNYSEFVFTVDDTNPVLVLNSPSNESIHTSGTVIDIAISDNNLDYVEYKWNTDSWAPFSAPYDTSLPEDDGEHILYVNASDLAGNYNYTVFSFTTDDSKPSVVLVTPANNTVQNGGSLIDLSVSDAHLEEVYYKWDSMSWNILNSPYDTNLPFGDGAHILQINATDAAENYNYSVYTFTVDDTNPSVVLNSPSNETIHNSGEIIDLSVSDTNIDSIAFKWDTDSWSPLSAQYDTSLPIGEGSHILYVNATDDAGNFNYTVFEFITDDLNPEIVLNSPSNNTIHNGGTIIDASVTDDNLLSVQYKWDSDSWNPWISPYDTNLPMGDGLHTLFVNGSDAVGNYNYTYYIFMSDDTNPAVILNSPQNDTVHNSGLSVDVIVIDTNLANVQYKWDSGSWDIWNSPYDTALPAGDGEHIMYVNATDDATNFNYSVFVFTIDDANPTVVLTSPMNDTLHKSTTLIDVSISDSNLASVYYKWDTGSWNPFDSPYDTNLLPGDGLHTLYVNASDLAGNYNFSIFSFTTDDTNPSVILNSPLNNSIQNSGITIDCLISDNNLALVQHKWDTGDWISWISPYDTTLPIGDDTHILYVNAIDEAGNSNNSLFMFTVDDTNPSVILVNPQNNTIHNSGTVIDVSVTDIHLDTVEYKWDGGSWTPWSSPYDTVLPTGDGEHTLYANAIDQASNFNYTLFVFIIDDTKPTVTINYPANNTIHKGSTAISLSISDVNLVIVNHKWDTNSWSEWIPPYDTVLPMGDGQHTLFVNAFDSAGNFNYSVYIFVTDETEPTITLNSPGNNTIQRSSATVNLSISDLYLVKASFKWDSDPWQTLNAPYDTLTPVGDGTHILRVNASDIAGNWNVELFLFTIDDVNPFIILHSPFNNSVQHSLTLVNVSVLDDDLDVVRYKWDDDDWAIWNEPYDTQIPTDDGPHTLKINASDDAENSVNVTYLFITDDTLPEIILNSPNNNTIQKSGVVVELSVSDANLDNVTYRWDSDSYQNLILPYDTSVPGGDGAHILSINAHDKAGNLKQVRIYINADNILPTIDLLNPLNNSVLIGNSLINLSVDDIHLSSVFYWWDSSEKQTMPIPYDTTVPIVDGLHILSVNASDTAGNWLTKNYTFTSDNEGPIIILHSPVNNTLHRSGVDVDLSISDIHLSLVLYRWDTSEWYELDAPYDTVLPSGDGPQILEIDAKDEAGNQEIVQFIWTVDDSSPIITLVTPLNGTSVLPESMIEIDVTDSYLNTCLYDWNESDAIACIPPFEIQAPSLEGFWVLKIIANDSLGNSRECLFMFRVTDPTPIITLVSPTIGGVYPPGTNVSVVIECAEEVLYNWRGASNITSTLEIEVEIPDSDGLHVLHVYARNLTYWNHDSFVFNTDGSPPEIELQLPQNNTVAVSGSLIQFSISDNFEIDFVNYSWDDEEFSSLESPYSLCLIEGEGAHILHLLAQDSVENQVEVQYVFHTDDTAPAIILTSPMNGSICLSGILVNFTISDTNGFGVAVAWDDGEYTIIDAPYNSPVPAGDDWHYLSIHAIDEAGNTNVTVYAFRADNTAPSV